MGGGERKRSRKRSLSRRDGKCCNYCKRPFRNLNEATIDHFIPLSKGGTNQMKNLVLCCEDCNTAKADKFI